jgi:hypothetical protein
MSPDQFTYGGCWRLLHTLAPQQGNRQRIGKPMEWLSTIAQIIRDLLIFVAVMTGLLIALVVVVSQMPDTNPLKRLLTALTYRVGATVAAGVLAIPVEPIPGIDALYDFVVPIALIWYWFTFFRDASRMSNVPQRGRTLLRQHEIDH